MKNRTTAVILFACAIAVLPRLISSPLPWNFSALAATALLCGAVVKRPLVAILIALSCRLVTDSIIQAKTGYGFYPSAAFDYAAYAMICLIGRTVSPKKWPSILGGGLAAAVTFFLVSNFGVWCVTGEQVVHGYSNDLRGLMDCYLKGIPFARGTFLGDILMSCGLFGIWNLVSETAAAPATTPAVAREE